MNCPKCSSLRKCEANFCTECGFSYAKLLQEIIESRNADDWSHVKTVLIFFCIYFASFYSTLIFPFFLKTFLGFHIVYWIALDVVLTFFFIAGVDRLKQFSWFNLKNGIISITGGVLGLIFIYFIYSKIFESMFKLSLTSFSTDNFSKMSISGLLYVCLLPAISEEIAFRSFIYEKLKLVLVRYDAIVLTSILFGVIHLQIQSFIFQFIAGIVLCWVKDNTKSIIPCILVHFLFNLVFFRFLN